MAKNETLAIFLKRLRLNHQDERLVDMAEKLDVSASFLSSVESGKRQMNDKMLERIMEVYQLSEEDYKELIYLRDLASKKLNVSMEFLEEDQKETVVQFLSNVKDLDEDSLEKINMIIKRKKGGNDS